MQDPQKFNIEPGRHYLIRSGRKVKLVKTIKRLRPGVWRVRNEHTETLSHCCEADLKPL